MKVTKAHGQICKECGEFAKAFIICEVCRKKICLKCAGDDNFCIEHLIKVKRIAIVDDYFKDKYEAKA